MSSLTYFFNLIHLIYYEIYDIKTKIVNNEVFNCCFILLKIPKWLIGEDFKLKFRNNLAYW